MQINNYTREPDSWGYNLGGIPKDTYFRYLKENPVFAEKMAEAKDNQNKVVFSFLTF